MADLKNPKVMYLKGGLFLLVGLLASAGLLLEAFSWKVALLLAIAVWSFCRCYYFAFYVIEHYVDGGQNRPVRHRKPHNVREGRTMPAASRHAASQNPTTPHTSVLAR